MIIDFQGSNSKGSDSSDGVSSQVSTRETKEEEVAGEKMAMLWEPYSNFRLFRICDPRLVGGAQQ